jgi:hypothetical protein
MLIDDYTNCFIFSVVASAVDFWITKNLSGRQDELFLVLTEFRLLVGLRWWSVIQEDGSEKWIFESREEQYKPNAVDKYLFWTSQFLAAGFWATFFALGVIGLNIKYVNIV